MKKKPILYTFNTYPKKKKRNPFISTLALSTTLFGIILMAISVVSIGTSFLGNSKGGSLALGLDIETRVAASTFTKDSDYTATPNADNSIIFEKKSTGPRAALIKIEPRAEGAYLYFGALCVAQIARDDRFEQVAMDGEVATLTDLDKNEYYIDCDKEKDTDMFSFRLLYTENIGAGTGGAEFYPYQLYNSGSISSPQALGGQSAQPQINYNFSPSNSFSPTIVNNPPAQQSTPAPTPAPIIPIPQIPLPSILP